MKRILCTLLAFCMLFVCLTSVASANEDARVEIRFRVGDSVLKINNADVAVETPYVVGEGVTLVPLRVITEAFGATVGWEGETQTITLDYPGVNIILQIGNPIAEVNGRLETLLAAPELPNSSTMVPLRFISETFGATVSYDDATTEILVVKEAKQDTSSTLQGGITSAFIGDSYFGWTMENPQDFEMTERSFEGSVTAFMRDENNGFILSVTPLAEDYSYLEDVSVTKHPLLNYTQVKSEKDPNEKFIHYQAKNEKYFFNVLVRIGEKYRYELVGKFENELTNLRDEGVRIMSTLQPSYDKDAFDLSTAKDGWRAYAEDELCFTMQIPENYYFSENESTYNEVVFRPFDTQDTTSRIFLGIYSKTDTVTAEALCTKDRTTNAKYYNPKYVNFTETVTATYNGFTAYEYSYTTLAMSNTRYMKDVFWEVGDYVYNASVMVKRSHSAPEKFAKTVLDKIVTNTIDSASVGSMLRTEVDLESTYTEKLGNRSIQLPQSFIKFESNADNVIFTDAATDMALNYTFVNYASLATSNGLAPYQAMRQFEEDDFAAYKAKTVKSTAPLKINEQTIYVHELTYVVNNFDIYHVVRYCIPAENHKYHLFTVLIPDYSYTEDALKTIENIITSFVS